MPQRVASSSPAGSRSPGTPVPGDGARRDAITGSPPPAVSLRLYVSQGSLHCERATRSLSQVLARYAPGAIALQILDVAREPERAARDRVLFTPTLIIVDRRDRTTHVLGSLSSPAVLVDLLQAAGLDPS